jgi:protein required for attachment to host cells
MQMRRQRTWFLVADAGRARIVRTLKGGGDALDELPVRWPHRKLCEMIADAPGRRVASVDRRSVASVDRRSVASVDRRRSTACYSDTIIEDMRSFAEALVSQLESHRLAGDFDRLVIVAQPRMIALIHVELSPPLRAVTFGEYPGDLARLPPQELREHLARLQPGLRPGH